MLSAKLKNERRLIILVEINEKKKNEYVYTGCLFLFYHERVLFDVVPVYSIPRHVDENVFI